MIYYPSQLLHTHGFQSEIYYPSQLLHTLALLACQDIFIAPLTRILTPNRQSLLTQPSTREDHGLCSGVFGFKARNHFQSGRGRSVTKICQHHPANSDAYHTFSNLCCSFDIDDVICWRCLSHLQNLATVCTFK